MLNEASKDPIERNVKYNFSADLTIWAKDIDDIHYQLSEHFKDVKNSKMKHEGSINVHIDERC